MLGLDGPAPGILAGNRGSEDGRGRGPSREALRCRARGAAAESGQVRRARPPVGHPILAIPQSRRTEEGEDRPLVPHGIRPRPRASSRRPARGGSHHHSGGHRRRRPSRPVQGLRQRAQHRNRARFRPRRGVRAAASLSAFLSGPQPRRRTGLRPRGLARGFRDAGYAVRRKPPHLGAGRVALRPQRQHQHVQHSRDRVSAGRLALPSAHQGVRTVCGRRREHLRTDLRP